MTRELTPELEEVYRLAEEASGFNADALRNMALLAYDRRKDKEAVKLLSFLWGRNSRALVHAVQMWPQYFMVVDGQREVDCSPDELLGLFAIGSLPNADAEHFYKLWRDQGLRAWQVRERIEALKARRREGDRPLRLKAKGKVKSVRGNSIALELEDVIIAPEDWDNAEVNVVITKVQEE